MLSIGRTPCPSVLSKSTFDSDEPKKVFAKGANIDTSLDIFG